jgi:hypothetical protein
MELNIKVEGIKELQAKLTDLQQNQVPYAVSRALNDTADEVQAKILETLPSEFTLRTGWYNPWTPFGFKVKKSTKSDLRAAISTVAPWMTMQETGGTKVAHNGHQYICIPTDNVRPNKSSLVPESMKPAYLLRGFTLKGSNKRKGLGKRAENTGVQAFIGTIHSTFGIWMRTQDRGVKLMYLMVSQAKITPRLDFYGQAKRTVDIIWPQALAKWIKEAIRTAK